MEWSGMIEELRDPSGSNRYNLDKLIGHGTYGNVYIGVNSITGLLANLNLLYKYEILYS